jgi:hypothetical protein
MFMGAQLVSRYGWQEDEGFLVSVTVLGGADAGSRWTREQRSMALCR